MNWLAMKALLRMREKPEVLEYCARNLFRSRTGYRASVWDSMADEEKVWWRRLALSVQKRRAEARHE